MDMVGAGWLETPAASWARNVILVLLLGLPIMAGLCIYQTIQTRRAGDDAMARSWADATKSFLGMMVTSWLLVYAGTWAVRYGLEYLAQQGG